MLSIIFTMSWNLKLIFDISSTAKGKPRNQNPGLPTQLKEQLQKKKLVYSCIRAIYKKWCDCKSNLVEGKKPTVNKIRVNLNKVHKDDNKLWSEIIDKNQSSQD